VLDRVRALVLPPAWRDVWICPYPNGHLQALGTDEAGRRQYRYHDLWRQRRDGAKFDHMLDFARKLPALRAHCVAVLEQRDGLDRERVLACAVRLLDHGFFRIGSERAVEEGDAVGLTTMRKEHATVRGRDAVEFNYPAKSGKRAIRQLADPAVVAIVGRLRRRRGGGEELLAYRADDGTWVDITATDVNDAIKQYCGQASSAKDFRTWNATVLAAVALAVTTGPVESVYARKRVIARVCGEVAHYLGNTPTVARNSYIDPRVFDRFRSGWTIGGALEAIAGADSFGTPSYQGEIERAVLDLLTEQTDAEGVIEVGELVAGLDEAER